MHRSFAALLIALPMLASAAPPALRGVAIMRDSKGKQAGTATLAQEENGVRIAIGVKGLTPGRHGFHVHVGGKCDFPDFNSVGPHFNPGKKAHGPADAAESHAGDLPELDADADGFASIGFIAKSLSLADGPTSLMAGAGTVLVVDAAPDDGKTEGGRKVLCGVIIKR